MGDDVLGLNDIAKSGSIAPGDVTLNGSLTAEQGRTFIDAIIDKSALLKEITVDKTKKLTKDRSGVGIDKGTLVRKISGKAVSEAKWSKLGVVGAHLDMTKGVVLQAVIPDDTLQDNSDNPNFESEQYDGFTTQFKNDIIYLGWVGTADNASEDAAFNELAKGWLTIAAESSDTIKETLTKASDEDRGTFVERCLQKLCDVAHEDITDSMDIFLSKKDYNAYLRKIAPQYQALAVLGSGQMANFEGRALKPQADIPEGTFLGTPAKNMVLGFSINIDRKRWYDNDKDALVYKFKAHPDYEFDIHKYVATVVEGS